LDQVTVFRREYVDITPGDILTALVLSQIVYWYLPSKETGKPKLRVSKQEDGKKVWWLAKSHVDWMTELGLTRKQISRSLQVLVEKGIIETKVYRFNGSPTVHIRLLKLKGGDIAYTAPKAHELYCSLESVPKTATTTPLLPQDQSITESTTQITKDYNTAKNTPIQVVVKIGEDVTADEIVKKQQGKECTTIPGQWQRKVALLEGNKFTGPLLKKEVGQLRHLEKFIGDKEQTKKLIDWVITNWMFFGDKAKTEDGLLAYPGSPSIGFLLKHYKVAMNLFLQSIAKAKVPVVTVELKKESPQPQENTKKDAPHKMTPEEYKEVMAAFE
jgi:hypothetical protein